MWASLTPLISPSMLWGLCVLVLAPLARLLCQWSCMHLCRLTSLLSMSRGFCVLLLAPWAHPLCCRAPVGLSQFSKLAILLLPQSVSFLWAEKCSYLCFLPSKSCLAWLSEIPQVPFGPPCEGASQCIGTLPASQLPLSLSAQVPVQKFSIFSLFMSLSSLLPYSRELILSLWRPGVFCCCLKLAL